MATDGHEPRRLSPKRRREHEPGPTPPKDHEEHKGLWLHFFFWGWWDLVFLVVIWAGVGMGLCPSVALGVHLC